MKPSLQSNTFPVSRFGKGRRCNHPKFPYRKNYRIAAHLISIYVPNPNHRIVELFAGSCSSIPAAHLLHRSMDFVEKDSIMYNMYRDKALEYFEKYKNSNDYYLATVTRKLKRRNRGEVSVNSDDEIPDDADDYHDPLQLRRVVVRNNESDDDDSVDEANNGNDDHADEAVDDEADDDEPNSGNDDQEENEDYVPGQVRVPKESEYSNPERSDSENEQGNNFKRF